MLVEIYSILFSLKYKQIFLASNRQSKSDLANSYTHCFGD